MKIALVSYEFPPETADGGIATYMVEVVQMLQSRGHYVEVFAGSRSGDYDELSGSVKIFKRVSKDHWGFSAAIYPIFKERHSTIGFDVVEAPECMGDAIDIMNNIPDIPIVIKLHTSHSYVLYLEDRASIYHYYRFLKDRLYHKLKRRQAPANLFEQVEREYTQNGDEIVAISRSIGEIYTKRWKLDPSKICTIPNIYTPTKQLLDIPLKTSTNRITYIGRLEYRKGIYDLAKAIPIVLEKRPEAQFRLVGRDQPMGFSSQTFKQYIQQRAGTNADRIEFTGKVDLATIPTLLSETDICVFPSVWENFPYVCLEAMAAGRGVIGSRAGGMNDMLDEGRSGVVIPPKNPAETAAAIISLLDNPEKRIDLGNKARQRVLSEYNAMRIGEMHEASYQRAIERRKSSGPRTFKVSTM